MHSRSDIAPQPGVSQLETSNLAGHSAASLISLRRAPLCQLPGHREGQIRRQAQASINEHLCGGCKLASRVLQLHREAERQLRPEFVDTPPDGRDLPERAAYADQAIRFFEVAARQVSDLVEAAADDAAVRRKHRLTLAGALLAVATAGIPAGALGAGGTTAAQRIQRLIDPPQPPTRARRAITSAALITATALVLAAPVLALLIMTRCPPAHYVLSW